MPGWAQTGFESSEDDAGAAGLVVEEFQAGVGAAFQVGVFPPAFQVGVLPLGAFHAGVRPEAAFHAGVLPEAAFQAGVLPLAAFHAGVLPLAAFHAGVLPLAAFHAGVFPLEAFQPGVLALDHAGVLPPAVPMDLASRCWRDPPVVALLPSTGMILSRSMLMSLLLVWSSTRAMLSMTSLMIPA